MTEKIRIALIIPGGIGTGKNNMGVPVLERLVRRLAPVFDITVFSLFKVNSTYRAEGFQLISIPGTNVLIRAIRLFWMFRAHHGKRRFAVVHGFWALPSGFLAVCLASLFGLKSVVSILGGDVVAMREIQYGQLQKPIHRRLVLWTLRHADEVVSLTKYLVANLARFDLNRNDIRIIPWGIDTSVFYFQPHIRQTVVEFYHIGNLHPVKDQHTLLKAFRLIVNEIPARLTIIGEGVDQEKVDQWLTDLNLKQHVSLLKQMPYESLVEHYHRADVLLHTSLSEGQCEVVTEAMSCGVMVCGTSVGLMYDIPECCFSVPVGDYNALASGVILLLSDPERAAHIVDNAHRWSTEHSMNWTVIKMSDLYSGLSGFNPHRQGLK